MSKVILVADDGSTQESSDASVVSATTAALAALPPAVEPVTPTIDEVDVKESDGTEETFVPQETPAEESAETPTV